MRREVVTLVTLGALAAFHVDGCRRGDPAPEVRAEATAKPADVTRTRLPVELIAAPEGGDVRDIVSGELARARVEGRRVLVYVGATWCEPCQRFHEAAKVGKLDDAFAGLRLVEFDLDRDRDRLASAGYASRMIPLMALPRADGAASGEQIEGSIKGPGAVDQIRPRLAALLEK